MFCRSISAADRLYVEAKDKHLNGDEEMAYVYYMRYYYVLKNIWKDPLYKAEKVIACPCVAVRRAVHVSIILCFVISGWLPRTWWPREARYLTDLIKLKLFCFMASILSFCKLQNCLISAGVFQCSFVKQ